MTPLDAQVKAYTVIHKDGSKVFLSCTDLEVLEKENACMATPAAVKGNGLAHKLNTPEEPSPSEE